MFGRSIELDLINAALKRSDLVGIVVSGPLGAGKSRLLDAAAQRGDEHGFHVVRLFGSHAASTLPLCAFSPLLVGQPGDQMTDRFVAIRGVLDEQAGRRPVMLCIDDVHLLDDASAILVAQLARELVTFVVCSARSGEPTPQPIAALWTQGIMETIPLAGLDREATTETLRDALGGPVDPGLDTELWRRTAGNPLHLRELALGSLAAGSIVRRGGVWMRDGALVTSERLTDLVGERLRSLSDVQRTTLCAVALAEPAGVALIEHVGDPDALIELEEAGLVRITEARRRLTVRLAHPVYGEVVRAQTSQLRVRRLRRSLAERVTGWGARRRDDTITVATWKLEAGDVDPELFARAAFDAVERHDVDLAERLAEAAHDHDPSVLSARALAMTRHLLGRHEDALVAIDTAMAGLDAGSTQWCSLGLLHGLIRARGVGDFPGAAEMLRSVLDREPSDRVRLRTEAMLAVIELLRGRATAALDRATVLAEAEVTVAEVFTAVVGGLTANGRPAQAVDVAERYLADHGAVDVRSLFPDFRWNALVEAGHLQTVEQELSAAWDVACDVGDRHRQARVAFVLGHVQIDAGRLAAARAWFGRAIELSTSIGERYGVRWALCGELLAAAQLGDVDAAEAAEAELARIPAHPAEMYEIYGERGRAWFEAARGQTAVARASLVTLADRLIADGCVAHAVRALVDLARLGDPVEARRRLQSLGTGVDGELLPLLVRFVEGLAEMSADGLTSVADAFRQRGYGGLAAEAAAMARDALARDGRARDANAWARRTADLTADADPAVTGLMFSVAGAVVPLTRREREIAALVAQGRTSKEVAEACFLSVRTVENHLSRVFDKLGVRSRSEVAEALGPLTVGRAA